MHHAAGVKSDGSLYTWGVSDFGQLGHSPAVVAQQKLELLDVEYDASRERTALDSHKTLAEQRNDALHPALNVPCVPLPCPVKFGSKLEFRIVSCGAYHTLAVTQTG